MYRTDAPLGCGSSREYCFGRKAVVLLCMESSTPPRDTAWAMLEENVEVVLQAYEA